MTGALRAARIGTGLVRQRFENQRQTLEVGQLPRKRIFCGNLAALRVSLLAMLPVATLFGQFLSGAAVCCRARRPGGGSWGGICGNRDPGAADSQFSAPE